MVPTEITNEFFKSKESLLSIIESAKLVKSEKLRLFLSGLKNYLVESSELKDLIINGDLELSDVYTNYEVTLRKYYYANTNWPAVNFRTKFKNSGISMSIRFEVSDNDGKCYVGIVTHQEGKRIKDIQVDSPYNKIDYFKGFPLTDKNHSRGWWLYIEEINFNNESLNFLYLNEAYADIFNDQTGDENRKKYYHSIAKEMYIIYNKLSNYDAFFNEEMKNNS